jgi:hypothetical protein
MLPLIKKIKSFNYPPLSDLALVTDGIQTADLLRTIFTQKPQDKERYLKALRSGKAIPHRYGSVEWDGWWVLKPEHTRKLKRPGFSYDSPKRKKCFSSEEKIIIRQTEPTILATLDSDGYLFPNSIFQIALEKHNHKKLVAFLALLNSRFLRFYYSNFSQVEGTTKPQIYLNLLKSLPIPDRIPTRLPTLADKMLKLNRDLQECAEDSDKYRAVQAEIEKVDKQIDQMVYKLYDLTPEEIGIVERS